MYKSGRLQGRRLRSNGGGLSALLLFFPAALFFMECAINLYSFEDHFHRGFFYTLFLTLPVGLVLFLLSSLGSRRINRTVSLVLLALFTLWYMTQLVYFHIFKTFLTVSMVGMAGDALSDYGSVAAEAILECILPLVALALPLAALCVFGGRFTPAKAVSLPAALTTLLGAAALQAGTVAVIYCSTAGVMSPQVLYFDTFVPELSVSNFGVVTTLRLDLANTLGGGQALPSPDRNPAATADPTPAVSPPPEPVVYAPNVMDIDFDALLANETDDDAAALHTYFSQREPTLKNEYTGLFAGKNLIFLTAEGFWKYAVDETLTPTLWKLANSGFVFEQFYNPLWWKSTTDGEYVACTGLIPTGAYRSFKASGANSMYFCMGNQLRRLGYPTTAYHNHTFDYYNRDISHPNMGYDYYARGAGLDITPTWPESDLEMMELTIPQLLAGATPFHNYYMTVSGHMNYNFMGNTMAHKHREAAQAAYPDNTEEFQAYKACNMELDRALEYLLDQLEQAGQLENTVICLSSDHYPYGMDPATWTELAGEELDSDFEIYRSTLILWSADMDEPVVVTKPCESLDILATLSNLFGLEYDSRLITGRDILADEPGLVILSNRSFITDLGRYNAKTDTFTPNAGVTVPEGYVLDMYNEVKDAFYYSVEILEHDYYAKVGLTVD